MSEPFGEDPSGWCRAVIETASDAILTVDENGLILTANQAVERIFGYRASEVIGKSLDLLVPESVFSSHLVGIRRFVESGVRSIPQGSVELAGRTAGGAEISLEVSFGTFRTPTGTVFTGIIRDSAERRTDSGTFRLIRDRFRAMIAATGQLVWTTSPDGQFITEQVYWRRYTGQTFEEHKGWGWMEALHPEDRENADRAWRESLSSGEPYQLAVRVRRRDGVYRTFSVRGVPVLERDGSVREWVGTNTDITEEVKAQEAREFLLQASEALASSLNFEETIRTIAKLALSKLADWCGIDVLSDGELIRLASVHRDPAKKAMAERLYHYHLDPHSKSAPWVALRTGESVLKSEVDPALLDSAAQNDEHRALLKELAAKSIIAVPLRSRGEVIGVISFIISQPDNRYGPDDLKLAEDLARQASTAVETARLFRENEEARTRLESQERDLAAQLQELRARARDLEENRAELELSGRELQEANRALLDRTTEAERARERVRASEVSYRSLFDSLTDLISVVDLDGNLLNVNEAVLQRFGYRRDEILGGPPSALTNGDPLVIAGISAHIQRAVLGQPQRFEYIARTKSGELFPKEEIATRGQYFGATVVICVGRDMTERRLAEDALARSEEQLRQIAENIREVFWVFDPDFSRTIYVSPAYEEIWGRTLESLYADSASFVEAVHPQDRPRVIAAMQGARSGVPVRIESRVVRPDGEVRWTWARGFPVYDESGVIYRVVGTTEDITERKRAEMERAAAESHYRRLVVLAPYGIFVTDLQGHLVELNPTGAEILGLDAEFLMGRYLSDVLDREQTSRAIRAFKEVAGRRAEHASLELSILRPSGERRLLAVILAAIREDDGTISGVHGTARDITEEREREKESRLLATALEKLEEGVSIQRLDGQIIYANSTHARLYGYDPDGAVLPNSSSFVPNEAEEERMKTMFQAIAEGGTWVGRVRHVRADDGRTIPLELIAGRVDRDDGESVIFNIARDISGMLQQEHQLRRVERLASVGTMIGGVAHELNNPLHAIRNFAEILLLDERSREDFEALDIIRREADRAAKVVSDLRLFARQTQEDVSEGGPVDTNDVVRHVLKVRRYSLETRNVAVVEELEEELPPVLGNRSELEQVLLNLIVNAEHAMASEARERRLAVRTSTSERGILITVADTGSGIANEHLERIFDPFWTTKAPGEGTGLGLSLVHSIVHDHRGEIRVESEVGSGTTFSIELPRATGVSHGMESEAQPMAGTAARPLRVLVVDDEESLRRSAERYLTRLGHTVDTAAEGGEALRLLEGSSYDVILSDLRMPGIDGEALLQSLKELGTGLDRRVVFITGDAANAQAARLLSGAGVPVLVKPVQLERIGRVVEQVGMSHQSRGAVGE